MSRAVPKGFTCKCGKFHLFDAWVYGHWGEDLTFTCHECGEQYSITRGRATRVK